MVKLNHSLLVNTSRKGALIDTNLLAVLLVGMIGKGQVERFKRTQAYTPEDAGGIESILKEFGWACSTPHVLAEMSNLLDWIKGDNRLVVLEALSRFVLNASEEHQAAKYLVQTPVYFKLGLSDAGLVALSKSRSLVLITADLSLYHYASNLGVQAINFNHLRETWLT